MENKMREEFEEWAMKPQPVEGASHLESYDIGWDDYANRYYSPLTRYAFEGYQAGRKHLIEKPLMCFDPISGKIHPVVEVSLEEAASALNFISAGHLSASAIEAIWERDKEHLCMQAKAVLSLIPNVIVKE